jgi:3D (Asp-Asp-Asp) domain-containing protein
MRYIPLETAGRGKVVAEDGRVFHIGDEVTVEAKKNLNDGIVTGILTSITGNYISISVPGCVLVTRCTSILKKDHI